MLPNTQIFKKQHEFKLSLISISITLITIYVFCGTLINYLLPTNTAKAVFLTVCILPFLIYFLRKYKSYFMTYCDLIMLLTIIPMLINNHNFKNSNFLQEYTYIILIFFLISSRISNSWHNIVIVLMKYFGLIYAVFTIWFYLDNKFYLKYIINIFPKENYADLYYAASKGYAAGLTHHYSTNAIFLSVGLGALVFTLLQKTKSLKFKDYIYISIVGFALLLTGKRAHVLFSAISFMIIYLLYNLNKPIKRYFKLVGAVIIILIITIVSSSFVPGVLNAYNRFVEMSEAGNLTSNRNQLISLALSFFSDNLLFGIGWDGFKYYYQVNFGTLLNVHNVYIQLLCETGLFGAAIFYTAFLTIIYNTFSLFVKSRKKTIDLDRKSEMLVAFALYIQIFFMLYCFTGNPLYDNSMIYPYIYSVAACSWFYVDLNKKRWIY